jgi:hypothetical protein
VSSKHCLVLAAAVAALAGCATDLPAPPPDSERYRCVEIPGGLVECSLREE